MDIAFYTLGCKVNQYETQALERILREKGHSIVPFGAAAGLYIINTCAVTGESARKSRTAVRAALKRNPGARVAVCGCLSQLDGGALSELDGVVFISGSAGRADFLRELEPLLSGRDASLGVKISGFPSEFERLPAGSIGGRTRALLKIQDGCDNHCTYCIIPKARGGVRSLPPKDAAEMAEGIEKEGYRELVLCGIELSSYGKDLGGVKLTEAVTAVCEAAPDVRVRLGSLEPRTVGEDFCEAVSKQPNLCPHFHLSLQSGCAATLKRMGRRYTPERFLETLRLLETYFPLCAVTTDLIVGFPGETEAEFEETLEFIRQCGFASMHIFPFSRREGTPAASMRDQIPKAVRSERAARAGAVKLGMSRDYCAKMAGRTLSVLFESEEGGVCSGTSENYLEVRAPGSGLRGRVLPVRIEHFGDEFLMGAVSAGDDAAIRPGGDYGGI